MGWPGGARNQMGPGARTDRVVVQGPAANSAVRQGWIQVVLVLCMCLSPRSLCLPQQTGRDWMEGLHPMCVVDSVPRTVPGTCQP